mmetsp:Transcript_1125/g.1995  ORF Transcript_1125/g.1995 Transcript_1125/m.1995 type:complete len:266 (+) Transcript_1125:402-1199(+)|eukprot:CAMPEP_0198209866 /NCGR_PEP_ID=MMETSP1445-20131203/17782_1 /TAXON_ID=36898 /ORGANISM="Pyramimonas sp., Strain CCMP2087" /LENGTH=265 /DNA_ID=CAMNT_0043883771 /DNA_START=378 /DNA_END=1175 /DNA_ORIENTATION=+
MGNTHVRQGKGHTGSRPPSPDSMGTTPPDSPGQRSPLTFSPQVVMNPILKQEPYGNSAPPRNIPGTTPQMTLIPTVITWSHGGNVVEVQGSFDNWSTRQPLHRHGKDLTLVKMLLPGVYQYKFIVDGEWKYAPDQPAMYDEMGNVNNVLEVQEYIPENLDSLSGFQPPASPPSSYNQMLPPPDDYAKEPPAVPPQLLLTLLNAPPNPDAPSLLPRPQHVILNHTYCEKSKNVWGTRVLGTTHRYRSKYVTVVMYKPEKAAHRPPH